MDRRRLDGWKAIATYINRSVRQCQRLAASSGLPIHKIPASRAVYAFADELDAWIAGRSLSGTPISSNATAHLTRSGRHVVIPVDTPPATPPPVSGVGRSEGPEHQSAVQPTVPPAVTTNIPAAKTSRPGTKGLVMTLAFAVAVVMTLLWGIHFRHETAWRSLGSPLSGLWTARSGGLFGQAQSVGRFNTGYLIGSGTAATVTVTSGGTRWSGGIEIFDDDLHWTFASISPHQHEIDIQRFPAGTVTTFFAGPSVACWKKVRLAISVRKNRITIACNGRTAGTVRLDPWDTRRGKLVLRVGSPGDELHEPSGGSCLFTSLHVTGAPRLLPPTIVSEVPESQRPSAVYTLTADNIDDEVDVLLDGRRLATAGYREHIGPVVINRFLTRGTHTLTMLLFNRKWSAAYGIRLQENGRDLLNERCGDVTSNHAACLALQTRLGMVKRLDFAFQTH